LHDLDCIKKTAPRRRDAVCAESRDRTEDTTIFSRVLYQLS
jgi:hypothetical protein